ncbi:MAG: type I restriction enzyme HsdR N-terminal domain-containing protein [Bacteroidales bacterium]|nr:type I restriction enzyme HsdR N-terminal domain-containing protein [Bacteroidales bacterium]
MVRLNLPDYDFRIRDSKGHTEIFDDIRLKYVVLTPEEWVRQNFIRYLLNEKNVPLMMMGVEKALSLNSLTKRTDILIFGSKGQPVMIVECKAPEVKIDQKVFEQISRYNLALRVSYLIVTNGLVHYCAKIDFIGNSFAFLEEIPDYKSMI